LCFIHPLQHTQLVISTNFPIAPYTWQEGWNGYDVAAPKPAAVLLAGLWIEQMFRDVAGSLSAWREPHVTELSCTVAFRGA